MRGQTFLRMHPIVERIGTKTVLAALATLSTFIIVIRAGDISLASAISIVDNRMLALALLVTIPFPLFSALRWKYTVNGMGIPLTFHHAFEVIMGTWLLSILPGRLGDFARPLALPRGTPAELGIGSVLIEKAFDILVLAIISTVGLLSLGLFRYAGIMILLLFAAGILLFRTGSLVSLVPIPFRQRLTNLAYAASRLALDRPAVGRIIMASTSNWLLSMLQVFFLFGAVGSVVSMSAVFAFTPLAIFVGLVPLTIAGMGTRDSALVLLFSGIAASSKTLGVGIWYSILGYWLFAVLGMPYLLRIIRARTV